MFNMHQQFKKMLGIYFSGNSKAIANYLCIEVLLIVLFMCCFAEGHKSHEKYSIEQRTNKQALLKIMFFQEYSHALGKKNSELIRKHLIVDIGNGKCVTDHALTTRGEIIKDYII